MWGLDGARSAEKKAMSVSITSFFLNYALALIKD